MLPHTWTPDALLSEARPHAGLAWRLVEAQHVVSTLKVVDTLEEQALLENILEETKPPIPAECRGLDYLLHTPFRYRPYPHGSRFRKAGFTPGVWYGSAEPETAVAEIAFYRTLFFAESPKTPFPDDPLVYTAFSAGLSTPYALNLQEPPLVRDAHLWEDLTAYGACQSLAETAREIGVEIILYRSVRDPSGRANLAVLTCRAFAQPSPLERQTWRIRISSSGVQALREHPALRIEFSPMVLGADPRLHGMRWDRS